MTNTVLPIKQVLKCTFEKQFFSDSYPQWIVVEMDIVQLIERKFKSGFQQYINNAIFFLTLVNIAIQAFIYCSLVLCHKLVMLTHNAKN